MQDDLLTISFQLGGVFKQRNLFPVLDIADLKVISEELFPELQGMDYVFIRAAGFKRPEMNVNAKNLGRILKDAMLKLKPRILTMRIVVDLSAYDEAENSNQEVKPKEVPEKKRDEISKSSNDFLTSLLSSIPQADVTALVKTKLVQNENFQNCLAEMFSKCISGLGDALVEDEAEESDNNNNIEEKKKSQDQLEELKADIEKQTAELQRVTAERIKEEERMKRIDLEINDKKEDVKRMCQEMLELATKRTDQEEMLLRKADQLKEVIIDKDKILVQILAKKNLLAEQTAEFDRMKAEMELMRQKFEEEREERDKFEEEKRSFEEELKKFEEKKSEEKKAAEEKQSESVVLMRQKTSEDIQKKLESLEKEKNKLNQLIEEKDTVLKESRENIKEEPESDFQKYMNQMKDMGFSETKKNSHLYVKHKGDLTKIMEELLK